MRRKLATITVAGALALGGAALGGAVLAGPALAETTAQGVADGAAEAVTSRVERITEALTALVDDGTITQEQADEVATTLADELPAGGRGGHHGPGGRLDLAAAAEALSLEPDALRTALAEDGATLASVAEAEGVDVADVVDALVASGQQHLDEELAEGDLTQEEVDERVAALRERVEQLVTAELPQRGEGGPGRGGHGPRGGSSGDAAEVPSDDSSTGSSTEATPSSWTYAA